jgi:hypothetical protein
MEKMKYSIRLLLKAFVTSNLNATIPATRTRKVCINDKLLKYWEVTLAMAPQFTVTTLLKYPNQEHSTLQVKKTQS